MLSTLPDLHRSFAEQLKLKFQSDSGDAANLLI